jgi:hypothetical protein
MNNEQVNRSDRVKDALASRVFLLAADILDGPGPEVDRMLPRS